MIEIKTFDRSCIEDASRLVLLKYNEEWTAVPALPEISELPEFDHFANNGLGVAAFENGEMTGFLCCFEPWENTFGSAAVGTFSPLHANAATGTNRVMLYKRMYQAAAEKWISEGISYHAVALRAHDIQAREALFSYGFGLRCIDAIRTVAPISCQYPDNVSFIALEKEKEPSIRPLRRMLSEHLGQSPCFMYSSEQAYERWLKRAETRDSKCFTALKHGQPIAFIEITDEGENFATYTDDMLNICGAFCLPEYRGQGIVQGLLNYIMSDLEKKGIKRLGVDFESFNPTASGFWLKYFTAYTNSVVRRIDEGILAK